MKQLLSFILFLVCLTAGAEDFTYTYEGQTLTYFIINEEAKTCGVGTKYEISGEVVIPSEAKNDRGSYKVTSIVHMAFSDCPGLTSITIPNSVTDIGGDAFGRCTGLKSVTIPNSVTNIGYDAFSGCTGLTSITIPSSVRTLKANLFEGCTSLEKLIIEDGTETLDLSAEGLFSDSPLKYLYLGRDLSYSSQSAEYSPFYNKSTLKEVTISNSVTSIGDYAFYGCSGLTSITIPNSVTSIGNYAFYDCSGLTSITIPNSVTTIGGSAFRYCTGLTSITIPNSVEAIDDNTFYRCESLEKLIIEDGTESLTLGDNLFSYCPLISIRLGRNLSYNNAPFSKNSTLKYVTISKSVTEIGNAMFKNCTGLTSITIPNSVTTIGVGAFENCTGLTSITIPNFVTSIESGVFYECTGLTSITIPNSVTTIGGSAFAYCSGLTSITIPNSVINIGSSAFYGCNGLTTVNIYDLAAWCKIKFDGKSSNPLSYTQNFYLNGEKVTNLVISDGITAIGDYAFYSCSSLTSIEMPNSITAIGNYAFEDCSSLTSIEIPNGVTTIGNDAFYRCSSLTAVSSFSTIPPKFTQYGFDDSVYENATLYVRFDAVDKYKKTDVWRNFKNIRFLGETELIYRYDDSNMTATVVGLYKDKLPADLVIPETRTLNDNTYSVVAINDNIFQGCTGLTSVEIPNSVTTIGAGAFQGCTDLTSVEIPNSVTTIGAGAFQGCTGLTAIKIPNGVTSIDYLAFADCSALTTIYSFNTTPPSIDYDTFAFEAYDNAILYVPNEAVEAYKNAEYWGLFWDIRGFDATGIKDVEATISTRKDSYYDINGRKLSAPQRGLNIINGRKVIIK